MRLVRRVDSTVVAVLLNKAIGHKLHCIFVNNGVLRENEGEEVVNYLREHFDLNLKYVDASKLFLDKLAGVDDPEKKQENYRTYLYRCFRARSERH